MKVLVVGASGALGRPLITRLLDAGHEVWGWPIVLTALKRSKGSAHIP